MGTDRALKQVHKLRLTTAALDDFARIAAYVARESDRATATGLIARLQEKCMRVAALPGTLGQQRPELRADLRSTPYGNYIIFFRYDEDAVEVVNIIEAHRDIAAHFKK